MSVPPPPPPLMVAPIPIPTPHPPPGTEQCYTSLRLSFDAAIDQLRQEAGVQLTEYKNKIQPQGQGDSDVGMGIAIFMSPLLQAILQCGPVCGLVALVEAGQILGHQLNPDVVLEHARNKKMTIQGEMFSVRNMMHLANEFIPDCETKLLNTNFKELGILGELSKWILSGNTALIPYDADHNHGPSLRNGHAAHWAVMHGIGVILPISEIMTAADICSKDAFSTDSEDSNVFVIDLKNTRLKESQIGDVMKLLNFEERNPDAIFLTAHQGKSKRTHIWKFKDLLQSNQNLKEISPKILNAPENYILEDITEELCSKLVMIGNSK